MDALGDVGNEGLETRGVPSVSSLQHRVVTGLLLSVIAFACISSTAEWPLYIISTVFCYFAAVELKTLIGFRSTPALLLALVASILSVWALMEWMAWPFAALVAVAIGTVAVLFRSFRKTAHPLDLLTLFWIAGPLACALWLHRVSVDPTRFFSPNLLLLLLVPIWIGDTAAYFVGKAFGKHLLAPAISPKKTWEGAVANLVACTLTAMLMGHIMNFGLEPKMMWYASASVGVSAGILGQFGDLLQSAFKRSAQIKDSGAILPGHGGVLDRLDSFLLASVPASLLLYWLARPCLALFNGP